MPIIDYKCKSCDKTEEHIIPHPVPEEIQCKECGHMMAKQVSMFGSYKWAPGTATSASVVPKKYRGEK